MQVVILIGNAEIVRVTAFACQLRRCRIDGKIEFVLCNRGRHHSHGKVRPDNTGQNINLFLLDHFISKLDSDVRFALIIFDHDFQIGIVCLFDSQHKAVTCINTQAGTTARKCGDHAYLYRIGLRRAGNKQCSHCCNGCLNTLHLSLRVYTFYSFSNTLIPRHLCLCASWFLRT